MGFRGKIARSTLADANEARDWRIYADFAQVLIAIARPIYALDPIGVDLARSESLSPLAASYASYDTSESIMKFAARDEAPGCS
jgi:hypothetical protein